MKGNSKLNLGCGGRPLEGWVNVDNIPSLNPDVVHDLDVFPYPFDGGVFEEVSLDHVLEHLKDPLSVLEEIHRISKDGASVSIKSPHFSCNWFHPRHKSAISTKLFDFLGSGKGESYGQAEFKVEKVVLRWMRPVASGRKKSSLLRAFASVIDFFAKLDPAVAERIWCYWVGGFEEIEFSVKVLKKR